MALVRVIQEDKADSQLRALYERYRAPWGGVDDILKIHGILPSTLTPHMDLYSSIMFGKGPLARRQREMIATVVSHENGCDYRIHHHSDALFRVTGERSFAMQLRFDDQAAPLSRKRDACWSMPRG